jgi:nucleoside-diphosphate-sugar epimerase
MRILFIGATGYVGGSVAARLLGEGHEIVGMARSAEKAAKLGERGIEPLIANLADLRVIADAARGADAVINAADADNSFIVHAILDALAGSHKRFIQTSGSSVVADRACGEGSGAIFTEDTPLEPLPERLLRVAVDGLVLGAVRRGVHGIVIRPALIYGEGSGLNPHSLQIPKLIGIAKERGIALHVGRGLNIWSHVFIDDVVELYVRALDAAPAGSLFYAENGEASWKSMASAVGRMLGLGPETQDWPLEEALAALGAAAVTSYGSNSRVRSLKARLMLGWTPQGPTLFDEIEKGCYRREFGRCK